MSERHPDKVQIGYHRAENTETVSSPHTYAHSPSTTAIPSTIYPDRPVIAHIRVRSAVAGCTRHRVGQDAASAHGHTNSSTSPSSYDGVAVVVKTESNEEDVCSSVLPAEEGRNSTTRRVETMSFEMTGVSPPVANLFRRLIMTEVPTLAFDRVLIEQNDSVVLDELLCHRIGLVPIAGPVMKMEYIVENQQVSFDALDPRRVLLFEVHAVGQADVAATPVYSRQLTWVPLPGQAEAWATARSEDADRVFLVHPDILLTKLGPHQELKLRAVAVKGLGVVHAKWSPVSACYYDMKTSITIAEPICGEDAHTLMRISPPGVFGIDDAGSVYVKDASRYTTDREFLRKDAYPTIAPKIRVEKDKTHVLFHLESVGQMHPAQIFRLALSLFAERCRVLSTLIQSTDVDIAE